MACKFDYSYLRGFIKEHFGNNKKFAEFTGISLTALYDRLANKVPFSQSEIDKVAKYSTGRELSAEEVSKLFFTHKIRKTV